MKALLDSDEKMGFRFSIGVSMPSSSVRLADREAIVQSVAKHYSVLSVKAELDQIVDGLKTMGVLDLFRSRPNLMRPLLMGKPPASLTSDYMINLFTPALSPSGSNQREGEDATVLQWINYVQMIEGMRTLTLSVVRAQ